MAKKLKLKVSETSKILADELRRMLSKMRGLENKKKK